MVHLVWLLGALIAAWGVTAVIKPERMHAFLRFMSRKRWYFIAAFVRLLFAVIFLMFGNDTRKPKVIWFLGLLFLTAGILVFVIPQHKIKSVINWWIARPLWVLRLWGVAAVLFGVLIIYAGWPVV